MDEDESIATRFAAIVAKHAGKVAVCSDDGSWTYSELDDRSNRVAAILQETSPPSDTPVGLLFDHGPNLIAAILGVLKLGRMYLALDPCEPPARLRTMLGHSGANRLLVDHANSGLAESILPPGCTLLNLDRASESATFDRLENISSSAGAWLMYTSGSTGEPKGVWQTHGGILHLSNVYAGLIELRPEDRLSLLASCSLAASATAIFGALLNGATLCPLHLRSQGVDRMLRWMTTRRISVLHTVPTIFRTAMRSADRKPACRHLRLIRLGGEPVLRADFEVFQKNCPEDARLLHAYSSTETGLACGLLIGRHAAVRELRMPLGKPVPGAEISLVDENGIDVAPGETGRIGVRGRGVAAGYWHPPAGLPDGFQSGLPTNGSRRFVTADIGRLNSEGFFEHHGRMDQQVKIRGQRVDLTRVEAALRTLHDVGDVATVATQDSVGAFKLVAYLAPRTSSVSAATVRKHLGNLVPASMIPDEVYALDELPLTPGGKIDRKTLATFPVNSHANDGKRLPARDWFEKGLLTIWEETLRTKPIGRADDFFDLGGTSIESAQILARVEDEFSVALPPSTLAERPTVEKLAALIGQRTIVTGISPLVRLRETGERRPLFLVHGGKGDVAMFGQLARRMENRPVWAFQSMGLNGESWPLMSIPAMARRYVDELQRVEPAGPLQLAGSCMGGLIAFEMARQLSRQRRTVTHLILIDTEYPAPSGRRLHWAERAIDPLRDALRIVRWALLRSSGIGRRNNWLPAYRRFVSAMNGRARRKYTVGHYTGSMSILHAGDASYSGGDLRLMMKDYAGSTSVHAVAGERARLLLPPAVDELAGQLNGILEDR